MGSCCSSEDDIDGVYNDDPEGRGRSHYRVERKLGGGTFGEVFRVRASDTRKSYALKIVHKRREAKGSIRAKKTRFPQRN
mmetsp:Transcript_29150/g.49433  ORF Transcript_29150/g.49433 Transcript_29150/m.49433 type:complete len:80 (+) Transcript_29150:1-240(+)